jgi:hypothetical protein
MGIGGVEIPLGRPRRPSEAERRRRGSDAGAKPLAALLAERQVRWVLAAARRAIHDDTEWDITRA